MTASIDCFKFAEIFNNVEKYPTIRDVAKALKITFRYARSRAAELRRLREVDKSVPELVVRTGSNGVKAKTKDNLSPEQHAQIRAKRLAEDVTDLLTGTMYPVINPGAVVVESYVAKRYNRSSRTYSDREGTPRVWLSDTLKVAQIKDCRNKAFIFTGAQNDADIHPIWENLKAYAKYRKATLVVGPGTYETQWWSENNPSSRAYAEEIEDHLCFGQMAIGDNFVFCGEMNILPTASQPVSDIQTYPCDRWGVFPAAKRQLKTVPSTDPDKQPHQVMSTGLCTKPKVIPRKAGIKSLFHYVAGAVIVEFDKDGDIFCRQITANKRGEFYDLEHFVSGGKVKVCKHQTIRAITGLDIHTAKLRPQNTRAIFGIDLRSWSKAKGTNVIDDLRPMEWLCHDLFDNQTRNHHNVHDDAMAYELAYRGKDSVLDEIKESAAFLRLIKRPWMKIRVIESNHDLALEKYVREGRYRGDGKNMRLGLQLEDAYLEYRERVGDALNNYESPPKFSVLEHAIRQLGIKELDDVRWVYDGTSYVIDGIENGHHFFRGSNGAKGTIKGFSKLGRKMSGGDKHQPEIDEGVFCGGVVELQHGYNKGPSGWCVTLIIQYVDGKRTLVTLQNGKHRA